VQKKQMVNALSSNKMPSFVKTKKMKNFLLVPLLIASFQTVVAQKKVNLVIAHKLGSAPFSYNTTVQNNLGQDFQFTRVNYYISGITIVHDGGVETLVPANTYLLVKADYNNFKFNLGQFNVTNIEAIKFNTGVNAPVNNQDITTWNLLHPLSFQTPSMHWGWTAGYIFMALEGKTGATMSNYFAMHAMFNQNYMEQQINLTGNNVGNEININLDADYTQALKNINLSLLPFHHGENLTDLDALKNFRASVFKPGSGTPLANTNITQEEIKLFPNPTTGAISITSLSPNSIITIVDCFGRIIVNTKVIQNNYSNTFDTKGTYIINITNPENKTSTKKVVVVL
jgi:Secretion system C-terminal sorting domain